MRRAIIRLTANCGAALRRIRQVEIGFDVWIDAICINQSNDDEKESPNPTDAPGLQEGALGGIVDWRGVLHSR